MTIKLKLILITVVGLLLTVAVLGGLSMKQAEEILKKNSYESLISKRDSKMEQLTSFFDERIVDMSVLVQGSDVKDMTKELISIHEHDDKGSKKASHVDGLV
ncbi:MAG: hypothetical protein KAR81_02675, partial [Sulfurimonas sp.]|nr:hypothetical protein [Sulfurimonas sp.]